MLRIIAKECHNNKTNLLLFVSLALKSFDTVPRTSLFNILEELKVPFKLRVVAIGLYENMIVKFWNTKGWSKEINCNIGVKQGCPLSPTHFGIHIDKLKGCLEEERCVGLTLASIVVMILLYTNDIVIMARGPYDLDK